MKFKRKFSYSVGDIIYSISWSTLNKEFVVAETEIGYIKIMGKNDIDIIYYSVYGDFLGTEEELNESQFISNFMSWWATEIGKSDTWFQKDIKMKFKRKFSYSVGDIVYFISWSTLNNEFIITETEVGYIKIIGKSDIDIIYFNVYGDFLGTEEEVNESLFSNLKMAKNRRDANNKRLYGLEEESKELDKEGEERNEQ